MTGLFKNLAEGPMLIYLLIWFYLSSVCSTDLQIEELNPTDSSACGTELVEENSILFLSTLDGSFFGVDHRTGKILWSFKREAAVKVPVNEKHSVMPLFLPDPKDGSLYVLNTGVQAGLKKLQFTIQQLVSSSPCRSTDGIFYTGKKIDNWFAVDWKTGKMQELLRSEDSNKICLLENRNSIFFGRTEYNLVMHDMKNADRRWNITYYDYAVNILPKEKINSEFSYFAGSNSGKFIVLRQNNEGSVMWESDFGSPVIGVYGRDGDGLVSLPFTTTDNDSLYALGLLKQDKRFFPTLYIGAHVHGLYALPAIATVNSPILLLDGPPSSGSSLPMPQYTQTDQLHTFLGHYKMPDYGNARLQITGRSDSIIQASVGSINRSMTDSRSVLKTVSVQTDFHGAIPIEKNNDIQEPPSYFVTRFLEGLLMQENVMLKLSMVCLVITMISMFIYLRAQMRELRQSSNPSSSRGSIPAASGSITAIAEELPDGAIRVGKIQFHTDNLLGKGCEGTFVFKGEFDNRAVAIKRLLPECFVVADREVCLLRESDQHPNVIRYFCMEQDKQFRYIALELCEATLQDYTENGVLNENISPMEVLNQATAGLEYLHAMNIVHRDIKPHNVLLSVPCEKIGSVRVMISDFGLCKKLQSGRGSFSRRSGITGTDGWIAPEIINGNGRTTTVVDIFSLGCVFYYVLSKGKHPFGDSFRRQANIMSGEFRLNDMPNDDPYELWQHIISKMLSRNPNERPSASVIKNHPAFWNKTTILSFMQDVSDRIEREDVTSNVLLALELGNISVITNGDWRYKIEPEIAEDLRKHRNYRGNSLRDLLRALRNKKHHYRELSIPVRNILGSIPDGFVKYWMSRFPVLLLHSWLAMQCVKSEEIFRRYYSDNYSFPPIHSNDVPPDWMISDAKFSTSKKKIDSNNFPKESIFNNNYFRVNLIDKKFQFFSKNSIPLSNGNFNWRNPEGYNQFENDNNTDVKIVSTSEDQDDDNNGNCINNNNSNKNDDDIENGDSSKELCNEESGNPDRENRKQIHNPSFTGNNIKHRNRHRPRKKVNIVLPNIGIA